MGCSLSIAEHIDPAPARTAVLRLAETVRRRGGRALVVGGAVRDALLGLPVVDVDLEVYGLPPDELKTLVADLFRIDLVGQAFGVIKLKDHPVDVAMPRRESKTGAGHRGFDIQSDPGMAPREAALRRDFTVNAMACDPLTGELLDYWGGQKDLAGRILRHVSPRFVEDPLRVLRGMQFVARYELNPDPGTVALCRAIRPGDLAQERVFREWSKLVQNGVRPSLGLNFLRDTGWIRLYPELSALIGCEQDPDWHPEGDVWTHTLLCMDAFARARTGDGREDLIVGLAVLCHDMGKPETTARMAGRVRSLGHDEVGAERARGFLARMTREKDLIEAVVKLVRVHMRPMALQKDQAGDSAIRRLASQAGRIDRLVRVADADRMGTLDPASDRTGRWLLERAEALRIKDSAPAPLVKGRHLLAHGMAPGPQMGRRLRQCYEAQLDGHFQTVAEGLEWLDRHETGSDGCA